MKQSKGHIARQVGLLITTAIAVAAIQHTAIGLEGRAVLTVLTMLIGAFTVAIASMEEA